MSSDLTLTWYYAGLVQAGAHDLRQRRGGAVVHTLDADYHPVAVRVSLGSPSVSKPVIVDIKDDGVSIFRDNPGLPRDVLENEFDGGIFAEVDLVRLSEGSLITLDIDQTGVGAQALKVELDLELA